MLLIVTWELCQEKPFEVGFGVCFHLSYRKLIGNSSNDRGNDMGNVT